MIGIYFLFFIPAILGAAPQAEGAPASNALPDPVELVRKSLDRDRVNQHRLRDYTYQEFEQFRETDSSGGTTKLESSTYDVVMIGDRPFKKKIAKNGKPLEGKDAEKAQAEFDKTVKERQREGEAERKKHAQEAEKRRAEERAFLNEVPEAYSLRIEGTEKVEGYNCWVVDLTPRAEYHPKAKRAGMLKKFKGRIWIDQQNYQWVKLEAVTIDTVSFGLFLARLNPGATLTFRQTRINSDVWLPVEVTTSYNAKLALLKRMRGDITFRWSNYRKFQTDSRIVLTETTEPER